MPDCYNYSINPAQHALARIRALHSAVKSDTLNKHARVPAIFSLLHIVRVASRSIRRAEGAEGAEGATSRVKLARVSGNPDGRTLAHMKEIPGNLDGETVRGPRGGFIANLCNV